MSNRILQVQIREHLLDPAQAELWITASAEHMTPTTELRGRLQGPRCLYAATVEIGYPLRPFPRRPAGVEGLAARVVIPEPSLWEPQCPFVYQGTAELWQDGVRCDQVPVRRGLRRVTIGRGGLRMNGGLLALSGRSVDECDGKQLVALRRAGCNLLLARTTECLGELLTLADVYGFLVLGAPNEGEQALSGIVGANADHPSFLGWLLKSMGDEEAVLRLRGGSGALIGVEIGDFSAGKPPEGVDFIACGAGVASELTKGKATSPLPPLLLLGDGPASPTQFGRVE